MDTMTTDQGPSEPVGSPQWVTLAEAADLLDVTAKTVRRKITAGELVAEKRHDPEIGSERWYVDASRLPRQPGTSAAVVPIEIVERIEALHRELTDAVATARRAVTVADFHSERRQSAEAEAERLRVELETARAALDAERARRWWQRRT